MNGTKQHMRSALIPICAMLAFASGVACAKVKLEESFSLTHAFSGQALKVDLRNGSINVRVSDDVAQIEMSGKKTVEAATDERAEALLENLDVVLDDISGDPGEIAVHLNNPGASMRENYGVSLDITIPAGTSLDLRTSNGTLSIDGNTQPVTAQTSNGKIHVKNQRGDVHATSSNGAVTVSSSSGAVVVQTSNGKIEIVTTSADAPKLVGRTSNGQITLRVPCDLAANLSAKTSNGSVRVDLQSSDGGTTSRNNFEGKLNGGGIPVELKTSNGGISVTCSKGSV
ncbi:MAG: DUF4097 domain-containing protein [Phycisphaerae bacterium]